MTPVLESFIAFFWIGIKRVSAFNVHKRSFLSCCNFSPNRQSDGPKLQLNSNASVITSLLDNVNSTEAFPLTSNTGMKYRLQICNSQRQATK